MKLHAILTITAMFLLTVFEFWHSWKENKNLFSRKESKKTMIVAIGALANNFAAKAITYFILDGVYTFRVFTLGNAWWVWIVAFIASDFSFYWFHRAQHHINWFWASHAVHHSSSDYNLLASLRGPWFTADLSGKVIFWTWTAIVGFHPLMMMIVYEFIKNYQFWIHTETIKRLHPAFEFIFNTPSHHRVHHGSDLKYLDKNNGGVFIFWDRMFGTFQMEEEHPVYGLTEKKMQSAGPLKLVFGEWENLFHKIIRCRSFKNAINYMVQPPGWSHDGSSRTVKQMRETNVSLK